MGVSLGQITTEANSTDFVSYPLFTIQIVSNQLHSDNMKIIQHKSIVLLNIKCPRLSKPKAKATKLHQEIEWRKKPWENPGSVGGQFSSGQ